MADPSETTQVSRGPAEADGEELLAAVRALATQVGGLQAELHALRAQARPLPVDGADRPGWDEGTPAPRDSPAWVRSLESPSVRRPAVPRLLLEIVFLVAVAVSSAVAGLEAPVVVAVMVGAWLLVALAEWAAARAARRQEAIVYGAVTASGPGFVDDPSWFAPPVERTALEISEIGDDTAARLPPPPSD